jgi:hypothetical protein
MLTLKRVISTNAPPPKPKKPPNQPPKMGAAIKIIVVIIVPIAIQVTSAKCIKINV